ncbi:hypothetical protein [Streptomyces sp. NPDC055709]
MGDDLLREPKPLVRHRRPGLHGQPQVPTRGYRYDLTAREQALAANPRRIMAVVAYTGDSRTHAVENLRTFAGLVDVNPRLLRMNTPT